MGDFLMANVVSNRLNLDRQETCTGHKFGLGSTEKKNLVFGGCHYIHPRSPKSHCVGITTYTSTILVDEVTCKQNKKTVR
jgi:hypothetical protein